MQKRRRLETVDETFQPEPVYISKILELASQGHSGNKFDISEVTGIPTGKQKGKVEPHIKYASYMNLINYEVEKGIYKLSLTDLGRIVFQEDRYLHEQLTKWICHLEISRMKTGAPQWSFLINDAHPGFISGISQERLINQANSYFDISVGFEELFGVVKRSYVDGIFDELDYVVFDTNSSEFWFEEKTYRDELTYVYAYAILKNWDNVLSEKKEITIVELIEKLNFGRIFGLNDEAIDEVLDQLKDDGILSINRQLFPTTIIRLGAAEDLIYKLYSKVL